MGVYAGNGVCVCVCVCVCVPGLDRRVPGNTVRLDSVCVTEAHLDQSVPGARRLHRRCGAAATPHHVDAIHRCGHRGWVAAPQGKVNAERPRISTSGVRPLPGIGRDEEAQASRIGPGFRGDGEVVRPVVYRGESFQLHVQLVARPGLEGDVHTLGPAPKIARTNFGITFEVFRRRVEMASFIPEGKGDDGEDDGGFSLMIATFHTAESAADIQAALDAIGSVSLE